MDTCTAHFLYMFQVRYNNAKKKKLSSTQKLPKADMPMNDGVKITTAKEALTIKQQDDAW